MAAKAKTAVLTASIVGACIVAIALVSGLFYEQAGRARDRERFPPVGRAVDIGGRTLNLDCAGEGRPPVILESGAPWALYIQPREAFESGVPRPGYSWVGIQRELARLTTVCWYDPAGSGWSDLGPYPRDSAAQARDLHALLARAGVPPPYVLVAESSAALDAHVYAEFYPAAVAGLVLVNGVHPDFLVRSRGGRIERLPRFVGHSQDVAAQLFNQIGLYRLGHSNRPAPGAPKGITSSEWNVIWHLTQSSKARSALMQDIGAWQRTAAEARAAGSLGDRPLIVLSSENVEATGSGGVWMELQTDLARLSTRGKNILAGGGIDLIYQAPDAIVEATREIVGDVRHSMGESR